MLERRLKALNYPEERFDPNNPSDMERISKWIREKNPSLSSLDSLIKDPNQLLEILDDLIVQEYPKIHSDYLCDDDDDECADDVTEGFLDICDVHSPQFNEGIGKLASILGLNPHPGNPLITLEAACKFIKEISLLRDDTSIDTDSNIDNVIDLANHNMGFDEKSITDPNVLKAVKVLRLLHIHQLRDFQTQINKIIVAVQKISANPKTDTKLAKVGY